jgi:hypothetical protein
MSKLEMLASSHDPLTSAAVRIAWKLRSVQLRPRENHALVLNQMKLSLTFLSGCVATFAALML